ncbi:hypothetical protein [Flavobacterium subsaxonicum]|uniref:Lipoprotein n=1 Tax=Flavobacterium subsaxonicum WB 4.1-42 = DSM 21790 TaxID=1121898 RepID=A0A0A2MS52_9FLAO|nr:hypothetical protein [Flavobacterium subsaxonicum]KGO94273.1 hypothetical protein Q766_04945 [Flavobacterium subsaxonicum WB 4.1-42 = DSM 21790]
MKKFSLAVACFSFLLMSCSSDDNALTAETVNQSNFINPNAGNRTVTDPKNLSNVYDGAGKMHAEILDEYLDHFTPTSVLSTVIYDVEDTSDGNSSFTAISSTYSGITTTALSNVISNATTPSTIITATTNTSTRGRNRLKDFTDMLPGFETADFDDVYDDIVDFEASIIADTLLTTADKQLILTTTSIARYGISYAKDRNRGWVKTQSSIVGAISGANTNTATAVITSVAAGAAD